jgi:hypothetical protein
LLEGGKVFFWGERLKCDCCEHIVEQQLRKYVKKADQGVYQDRKIFATVNATFSVFWPHNELESASALTGSAMSELYNPENPVTCGVLEFGVCEGFTMHGGRCVSELHTLKFPSIDGLQDLEVFGTNICGG